MSQENTTSGSAEAIDFKKTEEQFDSLLRFKNLDEHLDKVGSVRESFEDVLEVAIAEAFCDEGDAQEANLFLHRILYRINRLKLFWYDDLSEYTNETSVYISSVRSKIESEWQEWESKKVDFESLKHQEFEATVRERVAEDLATKPDETGKYFRDQMSLEGYRHLLGIASLDGLVEASQLSRVLGGVGNKIQSMLTRILLEEYGGGRLAKKHSSFFSAMLVELGMNSEPEAYRDLAPWEVLANINHSFFLSERKRNFLRYVGALLYTEVSVPSAFENYLEAGKRLGLSDQAIGYWDLHIKEDQRHGQWMLEDVALPLADIYKENSWEILWGYDQQRLFSKRIGEAIVRSISEAELA
ncbi:MAG: iron-containing redox enzyme family protein [Candidatus Nitronauta litoralis]|uniref:Iron-containing redox enzyme family protein n=1 Tax=Candidatus Nitronauta litoralis TaxID=2705533 RepID=A0A7T0BX73_9BACT|nr:MAG: iron-containing redox enzyme family protein [Candidatus Nitronauta litoralis]